MKTTTDSTENKLLVALQKGLPLDARPFACIGSKLGLTEKAVLAKVHDLFESGVARRFGAVFDSTSLGYQSTLCATDIPTAALETAVARIVAIIKQRSLLVVRTHLPFTKGNLQQLLESSVQRFQADNKLTAPVTIDNPLGELMFDTNYEVFEEVLSKILVNAWESYDGPATAPRPIAIHTELGERAGKGKILHIRIEDHGRGIDPEIRDRAFEPFVSSKHTVGVGMGLTVARHALRNLDGEVTLNDREGGGTSVLLVHPLEQKPRKRSDA